MFASAEEEARAYGFVSVTPQQLDAARAAADPAVERLSQGLPKGSDLSAAEAASVAALASLARRAETEGLGGMRIADALALQYEERQRLGELQAAMSRRRTAEEDPLSLAEAERVLEDQEMRVRKREVDVSLRMAAAAEAARVQEGYAPREDGPHSEPGDRRQVAPENTSDSLTVPMFEELKIMAPPNTRPVDLTAFLAAKHKQKEDRAKEDNARYARREAAEAEAAAAGGGAAAAPLSRYEEFQRVKADLRSPSTVPPAHASLEGPEADVRRSGSGKTMVSKTEELIALKAELRVSAAASQNAQASTSASLDVLLPEEPPSGAEPGADPSSNPEVDSAAPRSADDATSAGPSKEQLEEPPQPRPSLLSTEEAEQLKEPHQLRPSLLSAEEARALAQTKHELQLSAAQLAGKQVVPRPPRPTELLWTEDLTVARVTPQGPPPPLTAEERDELSAIKADLEASAAAFAADAKLFDAIAARSRGEAPPKPPTKSGLSAEERAELAALKLELRASAASLTHIDFSKRAQKEVPDMMPYSSPLSSRRGSITAPKPERNNSAKMIRPPTNSTAAAHDSSDAAADAVRPPPPGPARRPQMTRRMTRELINPELLSQTKEEKAAADAKQLAEAMAKGAVRRLVATALVVVPGEAGVGTASASGPTAATPVPQWDGESRVSVRVSAAALARGGAGAVELHVAGPSAADYAGSNQSPPATRVVAASGGARVVFTVRAEPRLSLAPVEERVRLSAEERGVLDRLKAELRVSASALDARQSVPQRVREAPSFNFTAKDKAAAAAKREAKRGQEEERERRRTAEKERRKLKKGAQKAERKRRKNSVSEAGSEDLESIKAELRAAASALVGCRVVLTATPREREETFVDAELTPLGGPPKVALSPEELEAARLDLDAVKKELRNSATALLRFSSQRRSLSSLAGEYVTKMELDAVRARATTAVSKLAAGLPLTEEDEHTVRALVRAANSAHAGGVAPTIADRIASKWVDRQALDALVNKAKMGGTLSVDEMDEMLEEQSRRAKARELEAARKASAADQRIADYANHKNSMSVPVGRRVFPGRNLVRRSSPVGSPLAAGSTRRWGEPVAAQPTEAKSKEPIEDEPVDESGKKQSRGSRGRKARRGLEDVEEEASTGPTMADMRIGNGTGGWKGAFRGIAEFLEAAVAEEGEEEEGEEEEGTADEEGTAEQSGESAPGGPCGMGFLLESAWYRARENILAHVKEERLQRAMAHFEHESAVFRAIFESEHGQKQEMPIDNPTMRAAMWGKVPPAHPRIKEKYKKFEEALPAVEEIEDEESEAPGSSASGRRRARRLEEERVPEEEERAADEVAAPSSGERRGGSRSHNPITRICREAGTQTDGEEWPAPREPVSRAVTADELTRAVTAEEEARAAEVARHAAEAAAALQREAAREAVREEAVRRAEAAERRLYEAEAAAAQRLVAEAKLDAERARLEAAASRLAEEREEMLAEDKARVAEEKVRVAGQTVRVAEAAAAQGLLHAAELERLAEARRAAEAERQRMETERQRHELERKLHAEETQRLAWENAKLKQEMALRVLAEENEALRRELEAARDAGNEAIAELARQMGSPQMGSLGRGAAFEPELPLPRLGSPGPVRPRGPSLVWGEQWEAPLGSPIGARLSHSGLLRAAHAAAQEELVPGRGVHADPSWRGPHSTGRLPTAPRSNAYEQRAGRTGSRSARAPRPPASHLELAAQPRSATADGALLPRLHGAVPAPPSPGSPRGFGASLAEGPAPGRPDGERRPARGGQRGQPPEYAPEYERGGSSLFVLEQGAGLRALSRRSLGGRPANEVPLPPATPRSMASPRRMERGAGFAETPGRPYEGLQGSPQRAYAT